MLSREEIEELEEELELDFDNNESVNRDIPCIHRMTTTPPLENYSDMVFYDISDQEDLEKDECSSDLHEIYEHSKKTAQRCG